MQKTQSLLLVATVATALAACGGSSYKSPGSSRGYAPAQKQATNDYDGDAVSAHESAPSAPPSEPLAGDDAGMAGGAKAGPLQHRGSADVMRQPERDRGLATTWGERRHSGVTEAPFSRANADHPFAVSKIFYNNPNAIDRMSRNAGGRRLRAESFPVGDGHLEVSLMSSRGFQSGFIAGEDNFVAGQNGQRYTIVIENLSPGRVEAVVSVDGLDVIDGQTATFGKRGYLVRPFGRVAIEGFRVSEREVATFRFGSVSNSYANRKTGETRNVGVIGVALFHERGDSPRNWGLPGRGHGHGRRGHADPFPNQFATPP